MVHSTASEAAPEAQMAYSTASMALRHLMTKPSAYHSLVGTAHSILSTVVLADLEAYTLALAAQAQVQNSIGFVVLQKTSGMWMYHIWNRMIGPALTRNYNSGSTLFVVPAGAHSRSRKYHQVDKVCYTARSALAMMKRKAVPPVVPVVS